MYIYRLNKINLHFRHSTQHSNKKTKNVNTNYDIRNKSAETRLQLISHISNLMIVVFPLSTTNSSLCTRKKLTWPIFFLYLVWFAF